MGVAHTCKKLSFLTSSRGILCRHAVENRKAVVGAKLRFAFGRAMFRGRCPHPQETEFLDFQPFGLGCR